jgi:hypothetical protein
MTADMAGGVDVETGALVLIGEFATLAWFARCLRVGEPVSVNLKPVLGRPAIRSIAQLHIGLGNDIATIRVEEDSVGLNGNRESVTLIADEVDLFLQYNDVNEPGMHAHLDSSRRSAGQQPLLAPGSRPLILAGPVPDSPAVIAELRRE